MIGVFYILAALLIIFVVFLAFQAVGGKLAGAEISEIGIFNGPKIFRFEVFGVAVSLNALPLGCYVKFTDDFENLHAFKKILIVLAGLFSYLIIALAALGFEQTAQQTVGGFGQVFAGLFAPIAVGAKYFERLAAILTVESFVAGLGILACKFLAFNLIPLGTLSGGNLVIYILEIFGFRSEKFNGKFGLLGLLFLLAFFAAYIVAFVVFLSSRLGYN